MRGGRPVQLRDRPYGHLTPRRASGLPIRKSRADHQSQDRECLVSHFRCRARPRRRGDRIRGCLAAIAHGRFWPIASCCFCQLSKHSGLAATRAISASSGTTMAQDRAVEAIRARLGASGRMRPDLPNRPRRWYGDGNPQNRSGAFLGALEEVAKRAETYTVSYTYPDYSPN
jgi:hypothetical protein